MGSKSRRNSASLRRALSREPARFEFFQAVRLLHRLHPDRDAVGRQADPNREVVRFRSDISFVFPPGDVRSIENPDAGGPEEMTVNFMGVASPGSFGSLPTPYTEELRRLEREKNPAMREFLDLFNHRLISLFYRAWERARISVLFELGVENPFESALRAVIGMEGQTLRGRMPFDERALLSRAGLLSMRPISASAIESLIESLFEIRSRVVQFVPGWYDVEAADRTRLGAANSTLGVDLNVGDRICLSQARFRLRIGPMDWDRYQSFMPDTDSFAAISATLQLAAGVEFDFDVQPVLAAGDVPALRLERAPQQPCRLGWSTWLGSEESLRDADDAIFAPSFEAPAARGGNEVSP
jgi:type VI secretion system protein ImpH